MKTILITGASGLLGTNLVATAKDLKIYAVVYTHTNLIVKDNLEVLQGDLTDPKFLDSLPNVDYIIHCAGYGQPKKFMADPITTIKLNTSTLISLFSKLNEGGKLLYLSSSEICSGAIIPYTEEDIGTTSPTHPRAAYIESKRCGETICHVLGGVIARVSSVYGPGVRLDDQRVMSEFIRQGIKGKIKLLDQGQAVRTYCYISDATELLWQILYTGAGVYNVGGRSSISILELAQKIANDLNAELEVGTTSLAGSPDTVKLDMSKTESEFKKHEYIDINEGITRTINWFKELEANHGT